jgi:uncharacterized protein (DUF433 family)
MRIAFAAEDFKMIPVHSDPQILGGRAVFAGVRVPLHALWNNLADGATLDDFLDWFPAISRGKAETALRYAYEKLAAATK